MFIKDKGVIVARPYSCGVRSLPEVEDFVLEPWPRKGWKRKAIRARVRYYAKTTTPVSVFVLMIIKLWPVDNDNNIIINIHGGPGVSFSRFASGLYSPWPSRSSSVRLSTRPTRLEIRICLFSPRRLFLLLILLIEDKTIEKIGLSSAANHF